MLFLLCIYLKVEYCVPWTRHLTELIWFPNTLSWILLWGLSFPWKCFYNLVVVKEMITEYCKQMLGYGEVAHLCLELNHKSMSFPWCWGEWLFPFLFFHLLSLPKQTSEPITMKHSVAGLVLEGLALGWKCLTAHTILQKPFMFCIYCFGINR